MLFCHLVITVCACTFVTCTLININQSTSPTGPPSRAFTQNYYISVLQITMTTGWLLLLLVVILSSHSVDSQSTTDDEVCDGDQLCELKRDLQAMMNRLG